MPLVVALLFVRVTELLVAAIVFLGKVPFGIFGFGEG